MALQMARNVASGGQANVLYICFEHDEQYLLNRLIAMESALAHLPAQDRRDQDPGRPQGDPRDLDGRGRGERPDGQQPAPAPVDGPHRALRPEPVPDARLADRQHHRQHPQARPGSTARCRAIGGWSSFVDYLQKVPQIPEPENETEKVTYLVNGLKDIALSEDVPMVCIVAADKEGLKASRLRNFHLRGSSAINYEADIILILNEKYHIVAKVNIEFNPYQAQRFRDWVIISVEKNRGGQDNVDLEFEKHFEFSCFDPNGRTVQEKLIEERLYND